MAFNAYAVYSLWNCIWRGRGTSILHRL